MRSSWVLMVVFMAVVAPAKIAEASEVTVSELIESAARFEGEAVVVEGELVGDYGFRGDGWMWTQLNGDNYVHQPIREGGQPVGGNSGIGIRMPTAMGEDLDPPGRYRMRGPIVRLTGLWKYHDVERQGETYLEVESLVVIEPGRALYQSPSWLLIGLGIGVSGAATIAWVIGSSSRLRCRRARRTTTRSEEEL